MSNPVDVQWFDSSMAGAPALAGVAGNLMTVLDACLVNGFGSVTLSSLVIASGLATATVSGGHGFTDYVVVVIAGATPSGLNGAKRLTRVSSTVFTFDATGISDQTATGTITAKVAALGWDKPYSGTNKAAYRPSAVDTSRLYLRVDDSGGGSAAYARVRGYETMSDVDTGTGPFPTDAQLSGGGYWGKSSSAGSTARAWRLFGDRAAFILAVQYDGNGWLGVFYGDIPSERAADAYNALLVAGLTTTGSNQGPLPYMVVGTAAIGHFMPRGYAQTGAAINPYKSGAARSSGYMGSAGSDFPTGPAGSTLYVSPVEVWDTTTVLRGILPGAYNPLHPAAALTDGALFPSIAGLSGRTLLLQRLVYGGSQYAAAIDLTGPWR